MQDNGVKAQEKMDILYDQNHLQAQLLSMELDEELEAQDMWV